MSDVNVSIVIIDSAMDCFEKIGEAANQYRQSVKSNTYNITLRVAKRIWKIETEISFLKRELSYLSFDESDSCKRDEIILELKQLESKLAELEALRDRATKLRDQYNDDSGLIVKAISVNVSDGLRVMATYLREISDIQGVSENETLETISNVFTGESNYRVVVIDSSKYPESAEHIKSAIEAGYPAMLTLDRSGAAKNRRRSLSGIPRSVNYDRDEYPPAAFSEGGSGAHVAYIAPSDNKGAGSSFRWQLNGVPDGARVRFRII